jgi:SagB-type dehydrogenase family enzyme
MTGHALDWASQPGVYKSYPEAATVNLIPVRRLKSESLWDMADPAYEKKSDGPFTLETLSEILALGSGITLTRKDGGTVYAFRSAASAGALYPVEIYVAVYRVGGIEPGLYHVNIRDYTLERLKSFSSEEAGFRDSIASLYLTGIFFRSAWKYRERAYRYILNDTGHVAGNLILSLRANGFAPEISYDFDDEKDRKSTRLNSSHRLTSRMPSSA